MKTSPTPSTTASTSNRPFRARFQTTRGYDFGEVSSAMQKAIRRGDTAHAGYWALELFASGYGHYVWKRLLTISAEDCWGIITREVKALHDSYALINKGVPAAKARGRIFISKAVILLCAAKKSRDADHLQNLLYDQIKGIDPDKLAEDLRQAPDYVPIPDYAFDVHTQAGRRKGRTKAEFFQAELAALQPFQPGLFDHLID